MVPVQDSAAAMESSGHCEGPYYPELTNPFSRGLSTQSTGIIRGMDRRTFEGRWEDCVLHAPEFAGRRVRITVLEEEEQAPPNRAPHNDDMLAVLRRAKDRAEKIPQTGSTKDSLKLLWVLSTKS